MLTETQAQDLVGRIGRGDRVSQDEARSLLAWGERHPGLRAVADDPRHPLHGRLQAWRATAALAAGGYADAALHGQVEDWSTLDGLTADRAAERVAAAKADPELSRALMTDPAMGALWTALQARAGGHAGYQAGDTGASPATPQRDGGGDRAATGSAGTGTLPAGTGAAAGAGAPPGAKTNPYSGLPDAKAMSQAEALDALNGLRANPDFIAKLGDASAVGHAQAKTAWSDLHNAAHPGVVTE